MYICFFWLRKTYEERTVLEIYDPNHQAVYLSSSLFGQCVTSTRN